MILVHYYEGLLYSKILAAINFDIGAKLIKVCTSLFKPNDQLS